MRGRRSEAPRLADRLAAKRKEPMRRPSTARASLFLVAALLFGLVSQVSAQNRIVPAAPSYTAEIDGFLRRAQKFEGESRWGEALSIYEEALRAFPDEPTLGSRRTLAKIHYDLGRRYTDSSYLRAIGTLSERQVMNLYSEVLVKIESHYVSAPDWGQLVARGTQGLTVALSEEGFRRQNLKAASSTAIDGYARSLARLNQTRVQTRQQAIDAVATAVSWGRQQLQLAPASVAMEYACGAIGALDAYSSYLTSDQLSDVYSQIEGNFVGLGIELKAGEGGLQIVKVITGSPADRAGIRAGDRITAVDGQDTTNLTTDQAADKLQGQENSVVELATITPAGAVRKLRVRREHVEVPSIDDVKIIDPDFGVGYLKLTCFQKTTSRDLDAALWKLHREGMKSLIIDLRGNPGGLLTVECRSG